MFNNCVEVAVFYGKNEVQGGNYTASVKTYQSQSNVAKFARSCPNEAFGFQVLTLRVSPPAHPETTSSQVEEIGEVGEQPEGQPIRAKDEAEEEARWIDEWVARNRAKEG
eukprot:9501902-Pyramimonas_sp.AAC.1